MDDFNITVLYESKNEWGARVLSILTPLIIDGFKEIFNEAVEMCVASGERDKYLMTFQRLISNIHSWNGSIIDIAVNKIIEHSSCKHLEDLVTCVHIIQLKILSSVRVGIKQKKIEMDIPKLDKFIHNVYIAVARKLYTAVYLFELDIPSLQCQKYKREFELLVQGCILDVIRKSVPDQSIINAYMGEITEEIEENPGQAEQQQQPKPDTTVSVVPVDPVITPSASVPALPAAPTNSPVPSSESAAITFNDIDSVVDTENIASNTIAPKTIERLEEISNMRNEERKQNNDDDDEDEVGESIVIHNDLLDLNAYVDLQDMNIPTTAANNVDLSDLLGDIEVLE